MDHSHDILYILKSYEGWNETQKIGREILNNEKIKVASQLVQLLNF